ncbi:MAG TPA: alpha/beta fold hydrolase [Caulobacteraceae bacterium]|nr:alpha/beta fold hydrolase [Caulobacteraceae bacterium]
MTTIFKTEAGAADVMARYRRVLDGWPVPSEERRLPTRQGETFVVTCGRADAPPLVLLHGAQSNAASWMFDAAAWSGRFRVYAVDMIGDAGLSAPARPPLAGDAHALWLDDVLAGLGVTRAAFVGLSLGGWLALDYATRRPERVERLALICPAGIGRQKNFLLKAAPLTLLGAWGMRKVRAMVFGPAPKELPEVVRPLMELMNLVGRELRPRVVKIPVISDAGLAGLTIPVLAIVGGKDVLIDSAETRDRLQRCAPNAEVVFLPEGRHFLPGQTARVGSFLAEGLRSAAFQAAL